MLKRLWIDGNGRVTCSDLHCAGQTAVSSRMRYDLHGARMVRVDNAAVAEFATYGYGVKCEGCGAKALVK